MCAGPACLAQERHRELAEVVAQQWHAHILHRAMLLNQDGQYEAGTEFVKRELRFYELYCEHLPEMRTSVDSLGEFSPMVARAIGRTTSKEMLLHSYKTSRGESDRRSRKRGAVEDLVKEELRRQGKS